HMFRNSVVYSYNHALRLHWDLAIYIQYSDQSFLLILGTQNHQQSCKNNLGMVRKAEMRETLKGLAQQYNGYSVIMLRKKFFHKTQSSIVKTLNFIKVRVV